MAAARRRIPPAPTVRGRRRGRRQPNTRFHPATFDTPHPALLVAGVLVFAYIDRHGRLRVSVHLDETEPWLLTAEHTVPMRITVEDTDVFTG